MNKLESTVVELARRHFASIQSFYNAQGAGRVDDENENSFIGDHGALTALLELGHLSDSGMSLEGVNALLEIEAEHAALVRRRTN